MPSVTISGETIEINGETIEIGAESGMDVIKYWSTTGSDAGDGSIGSPFETLEALRGTGNWPDAADTLVITCLDDVQLTLASGLIDVRSSIRLDTGGNDIYMGNLTTGSSAGIWQNTGQEADAVVDFTPQTGSMTIDCQDIEKSIQPCE